MHEMHRGMCEANNRYSHGTKHALDSYWQHTEYYNYNYIIVENTWMEAAYIAGTEVV